MKEDEIEKLVKKYKEGNSTLSEEQFLFDHAKNTKPSLEAWSTFVKNNKNEIPNNFNDRLWGSFENKKIGKYKRRKVVGILSTAASVLLVISFYIANSKQKELSYSEKKALLNEAVAMVSSSKTPVIHQSVIYENEMVVIYTAIE